MDRGLPGTHAAKRATTWWRRAEKDELRWTSHVNEVAAGTFYVAADSWYMGANVPGKPRGFMPYIGGAGKYRAECERVAQEGYDGFGFTTQAAEVA